MQSRGITLLETIVWIGLFIFAMLAIVSTLLSFYRTNRYTLEQAQAVASAQKGIDEMTSIIREAAYSSQGAYPIVSVAANDFIFYSDVDSDAFIERVHYYISGTSLMRGIANPSGDPPTYGAEEASVVADYIRNTAMSTSLFQFYNATGTEVTDYSLWSTVRFVKATVVVNVDPITAPNQISLTSSAALRNLY